jgi:hypothetical protein
MCDRLSAFLRPPALPLAELSAARLDGDLFALDDGYCSIDEPDTVDLRAEILSRLVPDWAVVAGQSAAWLHGALSMPPRIHEAFVRPARRGSLVSSRALLVRQIRMDADDVETLGGMLVTTPLRTAIDLARDHDVGSPGFDALSRLVDSRLVGAEAVERWLSVNRRLAGRRRVLTRLALAVEATLPGLDRPSASLSLDRPVTRETGSSAGDAAQPPLTR